MEGRRMDTSNSSQPNPWGSTSSRGRQVQVSANGVYNQKRRLPSSPEHSSDEDEAHNLPTNTRIHQASSSCNNLMKRRQTTHVPPSAMATPKRKYNLTPTQFLPLLFTEDSEAEGVSGSDDSDLDDRGLQEENDLDYSCSDEEGIEGTEERHVSLQDSVAFDWSDGSDFVPVLHKFQNNRSGVTQEWPCNDEARESDYFRAFLDDEVMSFVAEKTNAYYRWVFRHMELIPPKSRIRQWADTTARELLVFVALMLIRLDNPSASDTNEDEVAAPARPEKRRKKRKGRKTDLFIQREKSGKIGAFKWNDRRAVHLLSTIHKGEIVETGKIHHRTKNPILKPDVVVDYTQNMRLVDKSDCQLSSVECLRKSVKWYHKFFFHLIDVSMLNAYNIWLIRKDIDPTKKPKLREFIYNVAYQLLEKYGQPTTNIKGRRHNPLPDRIIEGYSRHYPIHTEMVNGQRQRKECYVCNHTTKRPKKRTRVNIICNECKIGLCVGDCFRDYHTLKNF
ncbi:hypothetical protein Pcinc_004038 [Petrolisthes cinctipes]|uniref:PiggyBac transposable element-derived protein domain-containing protein n=1 Tax=Petrolisthes cinctipes TaxID=88211 RepID=A0AAE1GI13_PETCI|nr:hypothetical protein Pcinc_004038 [Petrolisthes cinctipes]